MFDTKKFGAFLCRLRKEKDMTQSELSDILNVTRQAVSKYENGDSFPDISILMQIASVFGISLDSLLNAGNPTEVEKTVLAHVAMNKTEEIPEDVYQKDVLSKDILNIAPLLKASTLDHIVSGFKKYEIDISHIVKFAEFLNDKTINNLIDNASFENLDQETLIRFLPFLDDDSRMKLFDKILEGELDIDLIAYLRPYINNSLIENAVVCGVLDHKVLKYKL